MSASSANALDLDLVLKRAHALPALPQIVSKILKTLADDAANADTLGEQISGDPAIVARILAAANAGAFGGHPIHSVRQAILLLGLGRVKDITLATAIIERYQGVASFDSQHLWLHSLMISFQWRASIAGFFNSLMIGCSSRKSS
jgi:HD-like signal output (HDOD) protein